MLGCPGSTEDQSCNFRSGWFIFPAEQILPHWRSPAPACEQCQELSVSKSAGNWDGKGSRCFPWSLCSGFGWKSSFSSRRLVQGLDLCWRSVGSTGSVWLLPSRSQSLSCSSHKGWGGDTAGPQGTPGIPQTHRAQWIELGKEE